ncbi:hypothetical protein [Curtobacterium sp. YR515]|uniref:hypothetical protein n=1 Tax=Curtobacterium sp. YR515 TaxID=1855316 RepID=UPI0008E15DE4|nr:hypothetical protein [Curtobacterium sp. YR515]SFF95732.1 hypothetical protein SAMN05216329_3397 [Curtobacterium sp. YR515]
MRIPSVILATCVASAISVGAGALVAPAAFAASTAAPAAAVQPAAAQLVVTSPGEYLPGGDVLIAGTAEAGSDITFSSTGDFLLGETTADDRGDWQWTFDASDIGGDYTLRISDGRTSVDHTLRDVSPPTAGLVVTSGDTYDPGPDTVVAGTAEPGRRIVIESAYGWRLGETEADDQGDWRWEFDTSEYSGDIALRIRDGWNTVEHTLRDVSVPVPVSQITVTSADTYRPGDEHVLVSGHAEPGRTLEISTVGDFLLDRVVADDEGAWSWVFDASDVGGDYTLRIADGFSSVDHTLRDVS